jgi:ABC-type transporter Mla MlaB component
MPMSPVLPRRPIAVLRPRTNATVVLARGDAEIATWLLRRWGRADLAVVDHLARWQLAARRMGCSIRLRNVCAELAELLELAGLAEVLSGSGELRQVGREPEGLEQVGVEEAVVPDDPVA